MKLWQRYLFRHLIYSFLFFLLCLLILYTAVDLSIHGMHFFYKNSINWLWIGINYTSHFTKFLDLFFSLSFLLSSLKVLLKLYAHQELLALQTAGLSSKKLLLPFFFLAILLLAASYTNNQWISPYAQEAAADFHKLYAKKKHEKDERIFFITLKDGSELIYQSHDSKRQELRDVFWVLSANHFWHMQTLSIASSPVLASYADHFIRGETQDLERIESHTQYLLIDLPWENGTALRSFIPFESRPLIQLYKQAIGSSADNRKSAAHFYYKMAIPFFPLLIVFSIAPLIFHFSRRKSSFLLIAASLFAFVGLRILMDAMLILAENQVLSAVIALWSPIGIGFTLSLYFFWRMR